MLQTIGSVALLEKRKTAFFCSARAPGDAILRAHDSARELRDEGVTVISGFHSPIEKDCLRILLRGKQPIIICLARALEKIRLPSDWQRALEAGRLLILSPFEKRPRRPTVESARQRNELVAALADEVLIMHATPGGQIEQISGMVGRWGIPKRNNHA
jgi:predicted Rossmann fold nucleotide-binding protein DprA/Smf involved in DNA uptake